MNESRSRGPRRRECTYCPNPGADVCLRQIPTATGPGDFVFAHAACATARGASWLYRILTPAVH